MINDPPAGGAALLSIGVGEHHSFFGNPVDVGRLEAHEALRVGADVRQADVVAPDDDDVGFLVHRCRLAGDARQTDSGYGEQV